MADEDGWRKPELNVAGQRVFWDAQSGTYEARPMTNDNQPEMELVIRSCREISPCQDIVTL